MSNIGTASDESMLIIRLSEEFFLNSYGELELNRLRLESQVRTSQQIGESRRILLRRDKSSQAIED